VSAARVVTIGRLKLEIYHREYLIGRHTPRMVRCRLSIGDSLWGNGYGKTPTEAGADMEQRSGGHFQLTDEEKAVLAREQ